jgi:hypothetical protein
MQSVSLTAAPPEPATDALEPHPEPQTAGPPSDDCEEDMRVHDHRIALIGSISGSRLMRLRYMIRHEYRSRDNHRGCARLRGGSVDCCCDYCTFFWSRLEEKLR